MQHASPASSDRRARPHARLFLCLLLCLTAALAACSAKQDEETLQPAVPDRSCDKLYTSAPGFLVMELAAGSDIFVDPAARDFPVFCSKEEAQAHILLMVSAGKLPRGDWQVYGLNGGYADLGCRRNNGDFYLCKPARIVDWHPSEPVGIESRTVSAQDPQTGGLSVRRHTTAAAGTVQTAGQTSAQTEARSATQATKQAPVQTEVQPAGQTPVQTEGQSAEQAPLQTEAQPAEQAPVQPETPPTEQTPAQTEVQAAEQAPAQTVVQLT